MSNKIGQFEILSELSRSQSGSVYKANDTEGGQTVALKVFNGLSEQAPELVEQALEDAASAKVLNSPNLAVVYGAGEVDNQCYASLEYVQGNSVATMLARKEGFSIWDLQDIARQACQGLDHAHAKGLFHHSLEPSKIMVTWDGTVKILGFGTSQMGALAAQASGAPEAILHYMSPEQLRGDAVDARSNFFTLGAILYEMVTECKAFDGEYPDQLRQQVLEHTPAPPVHLNGKIHPALSDLIMKALSKAPEQRYQSGQELVADLEKCRERSARAASSPAQGLNVPKKPQPAAPATPSRPVATSAKPATAKTEPKPAAAAATPVKKPAQPPQPSIATPNQEFQVNSSVELPATQAPEPRARAAAAAAGGGSAAAPTRTVTRNLPDPKHAEPVITASAATSAPVEASTSEAVVEPEFETPGIAVDPAMDDSKSTQSSGPSFSEISELPPLKEVFIAPAPPPPTPDPVEPVKPAAVRRAAPPEKPRVPPREVARKAVREIKKTPPKLFAYSITAAVAIILLVIVGIAFHIHNENADDDGGAAQSRPTAAAPVAQAPSQADTAPPAETAPAPTEEAAPEAEVSEAPEVSVAPRHAARTRTNRRIRPTRSAPAVIPGQLTIHSTPEGAQVQVDDRADPSWVTPYNVTGLSPGTHTVSVLKAGYRTDSRTVEVASGGKSFLVIQLQQTTAMLAVTSTPPGAEVFLDGKDTGHVTPAQIPVNKPGNHSIVIKKQGYLSETISANLQAGQTTHFSPSLRALGNADDIKMAGRFKRLFGRGETAGMGKVSIKTNPKGAQIAVNRHIVDKPSPAEFYLNPGTYVIDITQSGYKTIHRVINVEQDGKLTLDETMQPE